MPSASTQGTEPLTEEQKRRRIRAFCAEIYDDAPTSLAWLLRGHLVTSPFLPLFIRRLLLRLGGVKIGRMVTGLQRCLFRSGKVSIGDGSFINDGFFVEGVGRVDIGRDVMFGPECLVITSHHPFDEHRVLARRTTTRDVVIGDGAAIGARTTILSGITVGPGVVIAAGSVVNRDCEAGHVYAGVPAVRVEPRGKTAPAG